jgi:RNA polymerase primary sigma factor
MNAVPNAEDDVDFLDEIYSRFMTLEVDVVDSLDKATLFESDKKGRKSDSSAISLSEISDDSIRMYLNEIGRVDLLNAEQEIELGRRIKL